MNLWDVVKNAYRGSWAFMLACPLLFLVPAVIEVIQHVVEVKIGMYDSIEMAKATEHHPARMIFGMIKIIALMVGTYWATRFVAFGNDKRAPGRLDPVALRLFSVYLAVQILLTAIGLYATTMSGSILLAQFLLSQIVAGMFMLWGTAASIGDPSIGPVRSAKLAGAHGLWIGFFGFVAILPLMIPHYALGAGALLIKQGPIVLWGMLLVDSLIVGLIAATMGTLCWHTSRWLMERRDEKFAFAMG